MSIKKSYFFKCKLQTKHRPLFKKKIHENSSKTDQLRKTIYLERWATTFLKIYPLEVVLLNTVFICLLFQLVRSQEMEKTTHFLFAYTTTKVISLH